MQYKQQWEEGIKMNIKCISPLHSLAWIISSGYPQISVAKKPVNKTNRIFKTFYSQHNFKSTIH